MDALSEDARHILQHLYKERLSRDRTPGIICMGIDLDGELCRGLLDELIEAGLVAVQDEWSYKLTTEGARAVEQELTR